MKCIVCKRTTIKKSLLRNVVVLFFVIFLFCFLLLLFLAYITVKRFTNIEQTNEYMNEILARRCIYYTYALQSKAVTLFLSECVDTPQVTFFGEVVLVVDVASSSSPT